jgi:hypothetical protein
MKRLLLLCVLALPLPAAEPLRPLDNYAGWTFADPSAWRWSGNDRFRTLTLQKQQEHKPAVRSPFNLAWLSRPDLKSFTLTVEARLTKFDAANNDLCIAFARQDDTHFYYVHLGETADGVHHQIHVVDNADRKAITATRTEGSPWQPGQWHRIRVTHDTEAGKIAVYFDDLSKPVLTAEDKRFTHGTIGLGSFDDTGEFRNLEITPGTP